MNLPVVREYAILILPSGGGSSRQGILGGSLPLQYDERIHALRIDQPQLSAVLNPMGMECYAKGYYARRVVRIVTLPKAQA